MEILVEIPDKIYENIERGMESGELSKSEIEILLGRYALQSINASKKQDEVVDSFDIDKVFPVGAIYSTITTDKHPSDIFPGTKWERYPTKYNSELNDHIWVRVE